MSGELSDVIAQVRDGQSPTESVRDLLRRFNFERRGYHKVREIRRALATAKLDTEPDFNSGPIDGLITYVARKKDEAKERPQPTAKVDVPQEIPAVAEAEFVSADPAYRMSRLEPADQELVTVKPDEDIRRATTLMMSNDVSQLPVMTQPRALKGIVSWKSLGACFALGSQPIAVRDVMDTEVVIVADDELLFSVIPRIIESDYALVRRKDRSYWIITTADLSSRFRELTEPFLLLAEIENQLRDLLDKHFDRSALAAAKSPEDADRKVDSAADLTLGEVQRLLEQEEAWERFAAALDRVEVVRQLSAVRDIRNDVMHFDPEGVGPADVQILRAFARFLRELRHWQPKSTPLAATHARKADPSAAGSVDKPGISSG